MICKLLLATLALYFCLEVTSGQHATGLNPPRDRTNHPTGLNPNPQHPTGFNPNQGRRTRSVPASIPSNPHSAGINPNNGQKLHTVRNPKDSTNSH